MNEKRMTLVAFAWGFSEATFFFIVPDVWLSFYALKTLNKKIFKAVFWTTLGALLGGIVMYVSGMSFPQETNNFLEWIPGINADLIKTAAKSMAEKGILSLALGPLKGIPYKIFSVYWGAQRGNVWAFCLVSIPARSARFILTVCITRWISFLLKKRVNSWEGRAKYFLLIFWVIFYFFYFLNFGG